MAADKLRTLHTVRRLEVDQARQALGQCLRAEAEAEQRIATLDDKLRRDRAAEIEGAHWFIDMFAARFATVHADYRTAIDVLAAARARSAEARSLVVSARTAMEVVEQLIAERDVAKRAEAARRDQHTLDDIARTRPARAFG